MRLLKQSTAYNLEVFMTDSADHISGKASLTLTITASKDGAAFASITPTVTDLGSGWYNLALTTTHTNTVGDFALHITSTGADPSDLVMQVRANVLGDTLASNVLQWNSTNVATPDTAGYPKITVKTGTGTGELDITSGVVKGNLVQILGTALTETVGQIAGGFKKLFDVASPVFTLLSTVQTGDSFARLGAPTLATISADLAAAKSETDTILAAVDTEIATLQTDVTTIKNKTNNLPEGIQKNTALSNFTFFMADSSDHVTGKTTLTVTGQRSKDGGAFANLDNTASIAEISNGFYKINLTANDLNADVVALRFTATGADATVLLIKTEV
jgi:hypothetical protein